MSMDGLFVLFFLTYVPVEGAHADAITAARDAALKQSGAESQFHLVKGALEKRLPPELAYLGPAYQIAVKHNAELRTKTLYLQATPTGGKAVFTLGF